MSRDIFIINGIASVLQRSETDITYLPMDDSVDVSLISENDWSNLVDSPGSDENFSDSEKKYLESIGILARQE